MYALRINSGTAKQKDRLRAVSWAENFSEFERAETKFIPDVGGRRPDERKRRIWVLLPHSEIFSRNRQPAESKHISARFGYPSDLCPGDLIDGQSFPFRLQPELAFVYSSLLRFRFS
jgi:hypothetical protein